MFFFVSYNVFSFSLIFAPLIWYIASYKYDCYVYYDIIIIIILLLVVFDRAVFAW